MLGLLSAAPSGPRPSRPPGGAETAGFREIPCYNCNIAAPAIVQLQAPAWPQLQPPNNPTSPNISGASVKLNLGRPAGDDNVAHVPAVGLPSLMTTHVVLRYLVSVLPSSHFVLPCQMRVCCVEKRNHHYCKVASAKDTVIVQYTWSNPCSDTRLIASTIHMYAGRMRYPGDHHHWAAVPPSTNES